MRLLQGRGSDCDSSRHRIIFPRMAERLAGASLEQYLQHFHEHRTAVFVANIQAAEFAEAIAAADSQFEPPMAHKVNQSDLFSEPNGLMQRCDDHRCPDPDAPGDS